MSSNLQNSIWPNTDGNLGNIKVQIPTNVEDWPKGDALVHNFVFNKGKLVGFVDTKALVNNESKSTIFPYDYVDITLPSILKDTITITPGERCKNLIVKNQEDAAIFITPILEKLLGEGKIKAEFIKNENKLIVHTDRVDDELLQSVTDILSNEIPQNIEIVRYNHHIEVSWRDINKYAECKNYTDMLAVNAEYSKDITSDFWWVYPLPSLKTAFFAHLIGVFSDYEKNKFAARKIIANMPLCTDGSYSFIYNGAVEEIEIYAPSMTTIYYGITQCPKLKKIKGYFPQLSIGTRGLGSRSPLEVFDAELPSLSDGSLAFENCKLDKDSALKILNSIPSYTSGSHPLTIGINIDHQTDDEVLAAIANAEAKKWTLTVQWNPGGPTYTTPEASTFAMRTLIYARVGKMERPDGNIEQFLDWGHYVTNPQDFQEFPSLQEAYSHFGIQPPSVLS